MSRPKKTPRSHKRKQAPNVAGGFGAFGAARHEQARRAAYRAKLEEQERARKQTATYKYRVFLRKNPLDFATRYCRMVCEWLASELGARQVVIEKTWRQSSAWLNEPVRAVSVRRGKALPGTLSFGVGDWPWKPADFDGFIWSTRLRLQTVTGNHQWFNLHKHTSDASRALGEIKRSARNLTVGTPSLPGGGRISGCDVIASNAPETSQEKIFFR